MAKKKPGHESRAANAAKGGTARAASLSREQRAAIAKRAAEERWAKVAGLPNETHAGVLKLGDGLPCSVLDNGTRVFSVNGLGRAFGSGAKGRAATDAGGELVPSFLAPDNLQPFLSEDLKRMLASPVAYRAMTGGRPALGYESDILHEICESYLDARAAGVLRITQLPLARAAELLIRAFAKVGVVALIDEATGYQYDRARTDLQKLLTAYVVEDMRPWVGLFPNSFFRQVYRIHGWEYKEGVTQGPRYVGKFINRYVYERLPAPVVTRLRELNPVIDKRRRHKHFQFLTEDIGEPTVDRHLASVTTLMSVSKDKSHFDEMFRTAFPALLGEQLQIAATTRPPVVQGRTHEVVISEEAEVVESITAEIISGTTVGGVEVQPDAVGAVRERIVAALRGAGTVPTVDLAVAVYGDSTPSTVAKLRKRLQIFRRQGLVEAQGRRHWRLTK